MPKDDQYLERPLPANVDAERLLLGAIMLTDEHFDAVSLIIDRASFSLEKHRRIWDRMKDLRERGERIERVTLMNELMRQGQLESVDGAGYVISLDEGLPGSPRPESYARIVQEKYALRSLIFAGQKLIDSAYIAESQPEDLVAQHTETLLSIQESRAAKDDGGRTPEEIVTQFPGGISQFLDPSTRSQGMPTGFTKLDDMTGGLKEGELIIIAGRPGHGKSAISLNIAEHLTLSPRQRKAVAYFSLEMTGESLLNRLICSVARVDQMKFRAGFLTKEERERVQAALFRVNESRLKIYDRATIMLADICAAIRKLVKEEGLHLAIVDYLTLIGSHRRRGYENRNQEISEMTRTFKLLAFELEIPIIVLSQLSRACETRPGDHRPILSDLRDSGSVEQDSDIVLFVYREELYQRDRENLRGVAEVLVSKSRNGPVGKVPLRFLGGFIRFENRSDEVSAEEGSPAPEPNTKRRRKRKDIDGN
jgi:replicative DNA helicase